VAHGAHAAVAVREARKAQPVAEEVGDQRVRRPTWQPYGYLRRWRKRSKRYKYA